MLLLTGDRGLAPTIFPDRARPCGERRRRVRPAPATAPGVRPIPPPTRSARAAKTSRPSRACAASTSSAQVVIRERADSCRGRGPPAPQRPVGAGRRVLAGDPGDDPEALTALCSMVARTIRTARSLSSVVPAPRAETANGADRASRRHDNEKERPSPPHLSTRSNVGAITCSVVDEASTSQNPLSTQARPSESPAPCAMVSSSGSRPDRHGWLRPQHPCRSQGSSAQSRAGPAVSSHPGHPRPSARRYRDRVPL